ILLHVASPVTDRLPLPEELRFAVRRVGVEALDLLDERSVTGREVLPPLPEVYLAQGMTCRLVADADGAPLVMGDLLEELLSAKLAEAQLGWFGWRLATCEPFHTAGTIRGLRAARAAL